MGASFFRAKEADIDRLPAHSFWAFACNRRLRLTGWGDYLRLVRAGMITPVTVRSWPELWGAVGVLRGFNVNRTEARATWRAYVQHLRSSDAGPAGSPMVSENLVSGAKCGDVAAAQELARRVRDVARAEATLAALLSEGAHKIAAPKLHPPER